MNYLSKTSFFPFKKGDLFELVKFPIWWDAVSPYKDVSRLYTGDFILVLEDPYPPTESYKKMYEEFPAFGLVARALVLNKFEILLMTVKEGNDHLRLISETKCQD